MVQLVSLTSKAGSRWSLTCVKEAASAGVLFGGLSESLSVISHGGSFGTNKSRCNILQSILHSFVIGSSG